MFKVSTKMNEFMFSALIMLFIIIFTYTAINSTNIFVLLFSLITIYLLISVYSKYAGEKFIEGEVIFLMIIILIVAHIIFLRNVKLILNFFAGLVILSTPFIYAFIVIKTMNIEVVNNDVIIYFDLIPLFRKKNINEYDNSSVVRSNVKSKEESPNNENENVGEESLQSKNSQLSAIHSET